MVDVMLTLNPTLMRNMSDDELIRGLDTEPSIMRTPVELELIGRIGALLVNGTPEEIEARLEKTYESALEQSYFRAELVSEIIELCDNHPNKYGETKELIRLIKLAVENSYVEL